MVPSRPGYLEAASSGVEIEWRIGFLLSHSPFQTFLAQAGSQIPEI